MNYCFLATISIPDKLHLHIAVEAVEANSSSSQENISYFVCEKFMQISDYVNALVKKVFSKEIIHQNNLHSCYETSLSSIF